MTMMGFRSKGLERDGGGFGAVPTLTTYGD